MTSHGINLQFKGPDLWQPRDWETSWVQAVLREDWVLEVRAKEREVKLIGLRGYLLHMLGALAREDYLPNQSHVEHMFWMILKAIEHKWISLDRSRLEVRVPKTEFGDLKLLLSRTSPLLSTEIGAVDVQRVFSSLGFVSHSSFAEFCRANNLPAPLEEVPFQVNEKMKGLKLKGLY